MLSFFSLCQSEAFSAIKQAYKESHEAAGKVNASETTLMESADVRENALDLLKQVQPANTRALDKLNLVMSSQPDLTPVAKQVRKMASLLNEVLAKLSWPALQR